MMPLPQKACTFVLRKHDGHRQVLAFQHPVAGRQWVKGTVEPGEEPMAAALRELSEESGLYGPAQLTALGTVMIRDPTALWHLFACTATGLPDHWDHQTTDDHGHRFRFFWHPLGTPLTADWHPQFAAPYDRLRSTLRGMDWTELAVHESWRLDNR